jgi:glycogen debranching enzyme
VPVRRLREFYPLLAAWTNWWMDHRDSDCDGVPQYLHGNDSGWDNATCFDVGVPLEGPDLASFLVIQMDVLAEVALKIGKKRDAHRWTKRADQLLERLIAHSWREDRFVAPRSATHKTATGGDSLVLFMPLVLGDRLPGEMRQKLIAGLSEDGRFITPYGLATESPRSAKYETDGYWRGPIWAPSTMLIVDGLLACGAKDLAIQIAERFCGMVAKSGMAENFDALTGKPLRDPAYTWTSSVFQMLAHDLLRGRAKGKS